MCFCWQPVGAIDLDGKLLEHGCSPRAEMAETTRSDRVTSKVRREGVLGMHNCETWADRGRPAGHRLSAALRMLGRMEDGRRMAAVVLSWSPVKSHLAGGQTCALQPKKTDPTWRVEDSRSRFSFMGEWVFLLLNEWLALAGPC